MRKSRKTVADEAWVTEDWTQITQPALRKRIQNRISQRKHRAKKRQQNQSGSLDIGVPQPPTPASSTNNKKRSAASTREDFVSTAAYQESGDILIDVGSRNWSNIQRHEDLVFGGDGLSSNPDVEWENWMTRHGMLELASMPDTPCSFPPGDAQIAAKIAGFNPNTSTNMHPVHITPEKPKYYSDNNHFSTDSEKTYCPTLSNPESPGAANSQAEPMVPSVEWDITQIDQFRRYLEELEAVAPPTSPSGIGVGTNSMCPRVGDADGAYVHGNPIMERDPVALTVLSGGGNLPSECIHRPSKINHLTVETAIEQQLLHHSYISEDQLVAGAVPPTSSPYYPQPSTTKHQGILSQYDTTLAQLTCQPNVQLDYITVALHDDNPSPNARIAASE